MAPFDIGYSSDLTTKISPLIEGQVPDFVQADHALFVKFLKSYYQFLEAGELRVTVNIDNLLLELETPSKVLDVDGEQIVLENGTLATGETVGTDGKFVVGETITGSTSKATATILVDDLGNSTPRMFISSQQQFQTGETITGGTSGATGTVDRYRGNPVQTIQQLVEYANVDNTIFDFLNQMRESFMNAIPNDLAAGIDRRNIIKNIRELYRAKGTSEGHKTFLRMILGEDSEIVYPNKFMMRSSDGNWVSAIILRCSPGVNAISTEIIGTTITGASSGATAVVSGALSTAEGGVAIVEFELNPDSIVGTFTDGETITGTSTVQDVSMTFTVRGMVTTFSVSNDGILYEVGDKVNLDTQSAIGNGEALAEVISVKRGSISDVIIDDAGTKFDVGDALTFTTTETSTNTKDATGFVSVIDGSLIIDGTDSSALDAGELLVIESGTITQLEDFQIVLDGGGTEASAVVNGATTSSTTVTLDGNSGTIVVGMTVSGNGIERDRGITVTAVSSQNSITISTALSLTDNINLFFDNVADGEGDSLVLDGIDGSSTHAGSNIILNQNGYDLPESLDTYGTETDSFALEEGTVGTGEITRIFVSDGGEGYSLLPTVSITSNGGTGAALLATTSDIGAVEEVGITNQGFNYTEEPEAQFRANFVVKDVTGTFLITNTLTTHTGTVKSWDSTTKVLEVDLEDVVRVTMETGDGESIQLEDSLFILGDRLGETDLQIDNQLAIDEEIVDENGDNIVLDSAFEGKQLDYFVIESGTDNESDGFLVDEDTRIGVFLHEGLDHSAIALETAPGRGVGSVDPTNGRDSYDKLISEQNGDLLIFETSGLSTEIFFESGNHARDRFVTEESKAVATRDGAGNKLLTDGFIERGIENEIRILLDGTDSSGTDSGDNIIGENTGNSIVLDGTDANSSNVNDLLLSDVEVLSGSIALNGTDSSSTHAGDNIINQDPIDFTVNTTITDSGGASATIVNADIAKGSTSIGTQAETIPSYGSNIESLVGEDLNRLQDSVFYQQFSYEIEAPASGGDYLPQLKKAVHPAGFNVFGKVAIATSISAGIGLTGSSLGGGYTADTDSFSPILASTFTILFDEKVSSRMGVSVGYGVNNFDDEILLETDDSELGDFVLNQTDSSGTDSGYRLVSETLPLNFIDFDGISITHGTQAGEFGVLVDETDGDKIISESAETISNSLLIDSTPDSNHIIPTDAGSAFLLNRTDSSGTDAGDNIELEQVLCDTTSFFTFQTQGAGATDSLVNEDGGNQQLETSGKGSEGNFERSIISRVERKISLPNVQVASLSTGLITLAQSPFVGHTDGGGIELELGTATSGVLILNGFEQLNAKGGVNKVISGGEFQLEEWTDQNYDSGFAFDQFANYTSDSIVLDGTDGSSTNAGDNILIDNYDETGRFYQARLEGEAVFNYNYFTLGDLIRPSIFVIDPVGGGELFGILQETDEIGSFRQEDGTTVAGTHGDEILLEDETGVGRNNKLSLEFQRIIPEDEVLKRDIHGFELTGTIPPENFTNSDVEPFVYPSEIESRNIGTTILEETIFEVTNIQLESGTNNALGGAVGNLVLDSSEDTSLGATDENAPIQMETSESIFRDHADGNIVLNGTDGSSTNADGNILHDAGTFLDILNNAAVIIDTSSEGGFDSSQFKFDTVQKTFDSTI